MTTQTVTGAPAWIDILCQDPGTITDFYGALLGWEFTDQGEDYGHYHMATKDGTPVAGLMKAMSPGGEPLPDMPTFWTTYLLTPDLAAALARVEDNGGTVNSPAMPVGTLGSMATVSSPSGGFLGLWQPAEFTGLEFTLDEGTPVWFEHMSTDFKPDILFYVRVFDWSLAATADDGTPAEFDPDSSSYVTHNGPDGGVCGLCNAAQWVDSSYWRPYFLVPDVDAAAEKVTELGGTVTDGPMDSPFGRLVSVEDPEGATFQLIQEVKR